MIILGPHGRKAVALDHKAEAHSSKKLHKYMMLLVLVNISFLLNLDTINKESPPNSTKCNEFFASIFIDPI